MKSFSLTVVLITSLMLIPIKSEAQNDGFGVGAQITAPAGLSFKAWLNETSAVQSLVSFNISENASVFHMQLDYLKHKKYDQLGWEVGELSYYYGGGARFIWREFVFEDNSFWALRLPAGLNFNFSEVPVDFYLEIAPTFEVSPDFNFGFAGGIGFRYFLN